MITSPFFTSSFSSPSISTGTVCLAVLMGMAKPMEFAPNTMAVLMPMTSPSILHSGPPLFPRLIAASVWIRFWKVRPCMANPCSPSRPRALTWPKETEPSNPRGLPMAMANSPTLTLSESPSVRGARGSFAWILITARSVSGSVPTTSASYSLPLCSRTTIFSASSTT